MQTLPNDAKRLYRPHPSTENIRHYFSGKSTMPRFEALLHNQKANGLATRSRGHLDTDRWIPLEKYMIFKTLFERLLVR